MGKWESAKWNSACGEASEFAPRTPDTSSSFSFFSPQNLERKIRAPTTFQNSRLVAIFDNMFEVGSSQNLVYM
jgi:hypothetical protein